MMCIPLFSALYRRGYWGSEITQEMAEPALNPEYLTFCLVPFSMVLCGLDILIHTLSKPLSCACSRSSLHSEDVTLWGKGATDLLLPDLLYPPLDLGALPLFSTALMPIGHTCGLCWMSRQTIAPAASLQMRIKSQDYNCSCKSRPDTQGEGGK